MSVFWEMVRHQVTALIIRSNVGVSVFFFLNPWPDHVRLSQEWQLLRFSNTQMRTAQQTKTAPRSQTGADET